MANESVYWDPVKVTNKNPADQLRLVVYPHNLTGLKALSKHITFTVSSMFLKGYHFLGGHIVLQGFAVFRTILNFHHVEVSKILSEFAQ